MYLAMLAWHGLSAVRHWGTTMNAIDMIGRCMIHQALTPLTESERPEAARPRDFEMPSRGPVVMTVADPGIEGHATTTVGAADPPAPYYADND